MGTPKGLGPPALEEQVVLRAPGDSVSVWRQLRGEGAEYPVPRHALTWACVHLPYQLPLGCD